MSATTRLLKANLHSHGRRYFSTGLAVAISTAFIIITLLFSNTMTSSLTGNVRNSYRGTTSVVTYSPSEDEALNMTATQVGNDFDALTQKIAKIQGVTAVGITAQYPIAVKAGNDQTTLFLSPALAESLSAVKMTEGKAPATASEIVIPQRTAKESSLKIGDKLTSLSRDDAVSAHEFTIVGTYSSGNRALAPSYVTTEGFEASTGMKPTGEIHVATNAPAVNKYGNPSTDDQEQWTHKLTTELASVKGVKVTSVSATVDKSLREIQVSAAMLTAIALIFPAIAILVASVVVSSTFRVLLQQRRRELALLRALGGSTKQVRSLVRRETYAVGGISSLVGIILGLLLGGFGLSAITEDTTFVDVISSISPLYVVLVWLFGTLLTVFVGRRPARAVSQVPPIAALSPINEADASSQKSHRVALTLGLLLTVLCGGSLFASLRIHNESQKFLASFGLSLLCLVGILITCTVIVPAATKLSGKLWPGMLARMARENTVRNPGRTAATGTSIVIGVTLVVTMMVGASSMRDSLINEVNERRPFDISVSSFSDEALSSDIQSRISSTDGVAATVPVYSTVGGANAEDGTIAPGGSGSEDAGTMPILGQPNYSTVAHSSVDQIDDATVMVSLGSLDGKNIKLCAAEGSCMTLKAKYDKNAKAPYEISQANLLKIAPKAPITGMIVKLKDGASATDVQKNLTKIDTGLSVGGSAIEREMYTDIINQMLLIVVGLLGVSVLVALVGVANTLSLSVAERTRENGLLRALGLTKRQMKSMLALEALFISVTGALIGTACGIFFGAIGILALPLEGITVFITIPWMQILAVVMIAILAALVASWLPGRRAAKVSPSVALAT
ncbi:ABC transporter permease, partial [Actinomyces sp.]